MPAVSQQQQKLFGLALSVKRGETPRSEASEEVLNIVDSMSEKDIKDFAETSHSGLPSKVEQQIRETLRELMREVAIQEAELPQATIPANVKTKLVQAIDKIKDTNLNYNQKLQVIGKIVDSLGIDKKELAKMSSKLKTTLESINEADPCWKGYQQIGMKKKDGKEVPNCVPESIQEGKKRFNTMYGVGSSKYVVNYHDGSKKHKDGSDFFDIKIFRNQKDLDTFKKALLQKGFIEESVNEVASRTAMEIGGLTGLNKDAIQKFVDTHNMDIEKVYQYVKKAKLTDRLNFVTAIVGTPGNSVQKKMIKMFGESVNEEKYPIAVEKFNKELIKHPMVKKAAQHYKKTPAEIVKVLQQRLYTKGDKTGNTKEVWIDFKDTTSGIVIKHKMKFNESINEADVVGKTIFSDGKGKLFFGYYKTDDAVEFVDYKTWAKLSFKDVSKSDMHKKQVLSTILGNQKQFNKKVEYNMWYKKTNPSFEQSMDYFIKNGFINNINKGGIKVN